MARPGDAGLAGARVSSPARATSVPHPQSPPRRPTRSGPRSGAASPSSSAARGFRSSSSTAVWAAPASGSRCSRAGRAATACSRSTPTATAIPARDRWRGHVRSGRWHEAFEEFIDFYNGPGAFAAWPQARRAEFLAAQEARGDLWDVLFDEERMTPEAVGGITAPVHVVEGSRTSAVDRAICAVLRRCVPHARHTLIDGAGHMMPITHPEPLARALMGAIELLGATSCQRRSPARVSSARVTATRATRAC